MCDHRIQLCLFGLRKHLNVPRLSEPINRIDVHQPDSSAISQYQHLTTEAVGEFLVIRQHLMHSGVCSLTIITIHWYTHVVFFVLKSRPSLLRFCVVIELRSWNGRTRPAIRNHHVLIRAVRLCCCIDIRTRAWPHSDGHVARRCQPRQERLKSWCWRAITASAILSTSQRVDEEEC